MGRSIIIIILLIIGSSAFGQSPKSVVKLTNGVRLKGNIIEFVQDDYMIMHLLDGNDLRIPFDYILSYKIKQGVNSSRGVRVKTFKLPEPGYFNYTSGGFLFLKEYWYEKTKVNPVIHMVNGYRFNDKYSAGVGMGLDNYRYTTALPMYISLRRDLFPLRATPTLNANFGYSYIWENDSFDDWNEFDQVEGGLFWEIGIGVRLNLSRTAIILNYAYKHQSSVFTQTSTVWWNVSNVLIQKRQFRNMALTVGIEF